MSDVIPPVRLAPLQELEAEAIEILREAIAQSERPAMLYSMGKDSSVLLHLARKAFFPAPLPFPLLHVDTTWKFREMYALRDAVGARHQLIVHTNPEAHAASVNPFDHGAAHHTDLWKTQGLRQAITAHRFDMLIGGARRDEEKSRAKERVFSLRDTDQRWDPRRQRPEFWRMVNAAKAPGESVRVFPLSNWSERDVWAYIAREGVEITSLYFAAPRPVVERDGALIVVDDDRFRLRAGEQPQTRTVRFRTLGCYPLTGAIESAAQSIEEIVAELEAARTSERQGRLIDHGAASMERMKREGYF
jgi:sulfate adenylyltransferase subunit 2